MIIEKDTKVLVHHETRGVFVAKARRTFSLDDDAYPLTVVDPMDARCIRGEEILPRAAVTTLDLIEEQPEPEPELTEEAFAEPESEIEELKSESEIENEDQPEPKREFGRMFSFGMRE